MAIQSRDPVQIQSRNKLLSTHSFINIQLLKLTFGVHLLKSQSNSCEKLLTTTCTLFTNNLKTKEGKSDEDIFYQDAHNSMYELYFTYNTHWFKDLKGVYMYANDPSTNTMHFNSHEIFDSCIHAIDPPIAMNFLNLPLKRH
ncbi:unnamed protein product [Mucor hiemalis]